MKRIVWLILIGFMFSITNCFSAPSNTLSITPTATDGGVIQASDENTRNNTVSTIYNAHTHTDISYTMSKAKNEFTRALDAATGDVSYTGVGFQPAIIHFLASVPIASASSVGWSGSTATSDAVLTNAYNDVAGRWDIIDEYCIYIYPAVGQTQVANLKSVDADGFTLTWIRTGTTPSGTITCKALCIK